VSQVRGREMVKRLACAAAALFAATAGLHAQASAAPSSAPSREITDEIGRTIRIPQTINRIVSLAPSLTETIYALGLQDRLVADTDYCDFPPEAQHKPKVGGAVNPSIEMIAALHPDIVLVTKNLNRLETVQALEHLGIPSYATDPHTVNAILGSTQHLADVLNAADSGVALTKDLRERLDAIQARIGLRPLRRVLFVVWSEPLISIGKSTFIADAIRHAGGESVIDASQNWPQVNLEEAVRLQPEFLVFAQTHAQGSAPSLDALAKLPGWRMLEAVRNRRAAVVSEGINWPSPRIVSAIEELARQLHPDAFPVDVGGQLCPERNEGKASPLPGKPAGRTCDSSHAIEAWACGR
jgi:iron complex transport system substrate-binding protein